MSADRGPTKEAVLILLILAVAYFFGMEAWLKIFG